MCAFYRSDKKLKEKAGAAAAIAAAQADEDAKKPKGTVG